MLKKISQLCISICCITYLVACSGESNSSSSSKNIDKSTTLSTTKTVENKKPVILLAKAETVSSTPPKKIKKQKIKHTLKLCVGSKKGSYYEVGQLLANKAINKGLKITLIETTGSLKNLQKIVKNKCDAAIVQSDAYFVFNAESQVVKTPLERVATLYDEYVHLICNRKAKIANIGVFEKKRNKAVLLIGGKGSGTALTWQAFTLLDKDYKQAKVKRIGGVAALAKILDGNEAQCMLQVDALKSAMMKKIDLQGKQLKLLPVNDWDFDNKKDSNGKKIYTFAKIPSGTYPKMQGSLFKGKKTLKLEAVLIVNKKWQKKNKKAYKAFINNTIDNIPAIKKMLKRR